MTARDCRVIVRRSPADLETPEPWVAVLVPVDGDADDRTPVGRFDSMPEAVTRGITAARFVAAGIPWRAAS